MNYIKNLLFLDVSIEFVKVKQHTAVSFVIVLFFLKFGFVCVYVSIFLCFCFIFLSGVWFIVTVVLFAACTFVACSNKDHSINQSISWSTNHIAPRIGRRRIRPDTGKYTSPMRCCDRCLRYDRHRAPSTDWTGCSWRPRNHPSMRSCTAAGTTGWSHYQDARNTDPSWDRGSVNKRHPGPLLALLVHITSQRRFNSVLFINKTRINYNIKRTSKTDGLSGHWQALTVAQV